MAKQEIYSLCIGINKLRRLKSGKDTVISREASDRWIRFKDQILQKEADKSKIL